MLSTMAVAAPRLQAAEEVGRFLQALKSQGYYDYAVLYMEQMKDSPLAPQEFLDDYLLEKGSLLLDYAHSTGDTNLREKLYAEAMENLQRFAEVNAGTLQGARANNQLAEVLVQRARLIAHKANLPSQEPNKAELMAEARGLFEQGEEVYQQSVEFYRNELKVLPNAIDQQQQPDLFEKRQELRGEFIQSLLQVATIKYERAKTYDLESAEGKKLLQEAAEEFGELYEDYRLWLAGLYARLYQGRCYQDLKDYKKAISYYEDLLNQPAEDPNFRVLIAKTYVQLAECLLAQVEDLSGDEKAAKLEELITRSFEWATKPRGQEAQMEDWLGIQYYVAYAQNELANHLDEADDPTTRAQRSQLRKSAKRLAKDAMSVPSDYRKRAQDLYAKLAKTGDPTAPKTFEEALDAGKTAVNVMEGLKREAAATQDADKKTELEQSIVDHRNEAIDSFRLALRKADDETDINQINLIRYYMCYLFWDMGRWYDAAVLGEFLARNYPDAAGARPCAKIAMASYLKAYNEPDNTNREFDAQRLADVAEYITRRWAGSAEANDANYMLVVFGIQQGRLDQAVEFLEKIEPDFVNRAKAELRVGQALWAEYIRLVKAKKDGEANPPQSRLDPLKADATRILEQGVERMRQGAEVTSTVASAALSLAQIYLDTQQYDKSVAMLEDEQFGPLRLIITNHSAAARDAFIEGAYKVALRAYVTKDPPEMEKAEAIMDALEAHVKKSGDADAAQKLTIIFYSLGKQLEEQILQIDNEAEKQELTKRFEVFLDRVAQQEHKENAWALQNWVALTYFNLGQGLDTGESVSSEAKQYYRKAADEYKKIIAGVKSGDLPLPTNEAGEPVHDAILSIEMRLAECERALGNYDAALDRLASVLEQKPLMLDAQKMAAYTYQEAGMEQEDETLLRKAYMGGRPKDGKNRIWGWHALSQKVRPFEKYRGIFHEARYNLALCRYSRAELQKTSDDRKKFYKYAEKDIASVYQVYPKLGAPKFPEWRDKYDALLKKAQKALGKEPLGLKLVDQEIEAARAQAANR